MGKLITIATLLWDPNKSSLSFSRMYSEEWANRLYRGFARNLTVPFRFVCFTDRPREFVPGIEQQRLSSSEPSYGDCIEPFRLGCPTILCGLDTVVTGNCDHLAEYCQTGAAIALPRDPFNDRQACNGVSLIPAGHQSTWSEWRGENDMEWLRGRPHVIMDDIWPGQVVSYKGHVKRYGLGDARIVFFHGAEKPHELDDVPWIGRHWR